VLVVAEVHESPAANRVASHVASGDPLVFDPQGRDWSEASVQPSAVEAQVPGVVRSGVRFVKDEFLIRRDVVDHVEVVVAVIVVDGSKLVSETAKTTLDRFHDVNIATIFFIYVQSTSRHG